MLYFFWGDTDIRGEITCNRGQELNCAGNCFNLSVIEFAPPHTSTAGPRGHSSQGKCDRSCTVHKKILQIWMFCTIVLLNQPDKMNLIKPFPPENLGECCLAPTMPLMSYIPPSSSSVFSFFLWIVFTSHSLRNSFFNKCLERCESFNDWIE